MKTILKGIYPITPPVLLSDNDYLEKCFRIITSGIKIFQFRAPYFSSRKKRGLLSEIYKFCIQFNVKLIINNDLDLVKKYDGSGLHIGKSDISVDKARKILGKDAVIGYSCQNKIINADKIRKLDINYLSIGSMFHTSTKKDTFLLNEKVLMHYKLNKVLPLCIIGGIDKVKINNVLQYHPEMIAISNGIFGEDMDNIIDTMRCMIQLINEKN